jgi:hypothetical protein
VDLCEKCHSKGTFSNGKVLKRCVLFAIAVPQGFFMFQIIILLLIRLRLLQQPILCHTMLMMITQATAIWENSITWVEMTFFATA